MNHLTTLYVNQADRERQITEDLRNRQILQVEGLQQADPARRDGTQLDGRKARQDAPALNARTANR
jgi:hypothetical protein